MSTSYDPLSLHLLAQSYAYPPSNGLTQTDRDYFRMVRTENGMSDFAIFAKEDKSDDEDEKEEEEGSNKSANEDVAPMRKTEGDEVS